jgi:alkaline phosphatase D
MNSTLLAIAALTMLPCLDARPQTSAHPGNESGLPPVPPDAAIEGAPFLKCGPMLGHVAHDRALLWIKSSNAAKPSVAISLHADLRDSRIVNGPALTEATAFAGTVELPDLAPATRYFYSVLLDGEPATVRPATSFTTAPAPGARGKQRVAFVSCSGYRGYMSAASWGEMAARGNFDLLLQLGDNHYANTTKLPKLRADYTMHRSVASFRALTAGLPTYGIWDDHDYGPNDSDGTLAGKEDSLRAFKEFWANPAFGIADAPGCFFRFTRGDVDFFMLDVRYHRSPDKAEKDGSKTMLGASQLQWLKRELKASKAKIKFIASGSVFESKGPLDSWASYPAERRALLDFLRDEIGDGVILLSGDRHFTAGYQVEGRFLEVTSGPVGSGNATAGISDEVWLASSIGKMWSIFEVDTTGDTPKVAYELWHTGAGLTERREFTWDEVNGRAKIAPSPALLKAAKKKETP